MGISVMRKAELWTALPHAGLCHLCERQCVLEESARGPCGLREYRDGVLWTRADGRFVKIAPRAIESLGLYHVLPGSRALLATFADAPVDGPEAAPSGTSSIGELPELARTASAASIAFAAAGRAGPPGFADPTLHYEVLAPALQLARDRGFVTVVRATGAATCATYARLASLIDAVSLEIPTLHDATARRLEGVPSHVVRASLATLRSRGVWVEVTTVLVPGMNDSERELLEIALSLRSIDPTIPWHVRCAAADEPRGAADRAIERALDAGARAGLEYVYTAESAGADREVTFCHVCRDEVLIERFLGQPRNLMAGGLRCRRCLTPARGLFHRRSRAACYGARAAASALP
jgi:pyruvate formate lyase activating enzyme